MVVSPVRLTRSTCESLAAAGWLMSDARIADISSARIFHLYPSSRPAPAYGTSLRCLYNTHGMGSPEVTNAQVERLYQQARAERWNLSREVFAEALAASAGKAFAGTTPTARAIERYLTSLRLEDLALACGCATGNDAAWDQFVAEQRPVLYRAADALDPSGGAREVADSMYADLYGLQDGEGARRSLFRYFHGRSSLATWLRAVLSQRFIED